MPLRQLSLSFALRKKLTIYFRHNQAKFSTKVNLKYTMMIPSEKFFIWRDFNAEESTSSDRFIQIAFDYAQQNNKNERIYMKRPYLEEFVRTKKRLLCKLKNLLPQIDSNEEENIILPFTKTGEIIPEQTSNYNVFFGQNGCEKIKIAETEYSIVRDAVWLDKLEIVLDPLVGCPIMPSADWKNKSDSLKYHWFVSENKIPLKIQIVDSPKCRIHLDGWEYAGTGLYYCPSKLDIGKYLAVVVDVGEEGITNGAICEKKIKEANDSDEGEELIFERRQTDYCGESLTGDRYRVLSYNVLAHLYLNDWLKKKEQADQYFPYCPKEFQFDKYRYPLLLREIPGYNADLLFLQEVDFRFQRRFLVPFLQLKGFTAVFNCKENQVNEGLVVAFRTDRFQLVQCENYSIKLSKLLENPFNADILAFLKANEDIFRVLSTRPTILQLVHLRTTQGLDILAGNTHLHYDPAHEEVKILQSLLCLRYISSFITDKIFGQSPQILFAGDFNCQPDSAAVRMLQGEQIHLPLDGHGLDQIQPSFIQRLWAYIQRNFLANGTNSERIVIREPINLQCVSGFPEYTNFTRAEGFSKKAFVGCLDYIWAHPPVQVDRQVPMPAHRLVTKFGAIPSKICPSDHLPLIADLTIRAKSQ